MKMATSSIFISFILATTIFTGVFANIPYQPPPYGRTIEGHFTYNQEIGKDACGTNVNYETELVAAVNCSYWKTFPNGNPNEDPICQDTCLKITYKGKEVTVKVVDQCCGCGTDHVDLSIPAYKALDENMQDGDVKGASWVFTKCDGSEASSGSSSSSSSDPSSDPSSNPSSGQNSNPSSSNPNNNGNGNNNNNGNNGSGGGILGGLANAFGSFKNFFSGIFGGPFGKLSSLIG